MNRFLSLFFQLILIISSCSSPPINNREDQKVLDKEIQARLKQIQHYEDSLSENVFHVELIHQKAQDLILLSKDNENHSASINMSNAYFSQLVQKLGLNGSELRALSFELKTEEMAFIIKQNELNILNQLALHKLKMAIPLKAVY